MVEVDERFSNQRMRKRVAERVVKGGRSGEVVERYRECLVMVTSELAREVRAGNGKIDLIK